MSALHKKESGFTLTELIVGMVVATLLSVAIVSSVVIWLSQYAVGSTRQTMTTDLQAALARMSDDIRGSYAVLPENAVSDPNAPSTPGKWVLGPSRLILAQTPRDADGDALYTSSALFSGTPDSIVYYLRDNTLYRRIVPASNYPDNVNKLVDCSPQTGGCPQDIVVLRDVTSAVFEYFDNENDTGATPDNTKSVLIRLETNRKQSGQTIVAKDQVRMSLQDLATIVPPTPPDDEDDDPPPSPQTSAGLAVGPGGLQLSFSDITGRDIYVKGRLTLSSLSTVDISGHRLEVANIGCGSGASYPSACTGQQPINVSFGGEVNASPICAPGQTVMTGLTGFQSCPAPNKTLPPFNKGAFTSTMTTNSSNVSCSLFSDVTIPAKRRVDGNVSASFCDLSFQGDAYIVGNLSATNQATIKVANGVSTRPVIVVNGTVSISYSDIEANNLGITPYIISFSSANNGCSISDSCVSISNTELQNSINGISPAITLIGYGDIKASLYAYFGTMRIISVDVTGALAGQKVELSNLAGVQLTQGIWPG